VINADLHVQGHIAEQIACRRESRSDLKWIRSWPFIRTPVGVLRGVPARRGVRDRSDDNDAANGALVDDGLHGYRGQSGRTPALAEVGLASDSGSVVQQCQWAANIPALPVQKIE